MSYTFHDILIILQCPDSKGTESPVVVIKEAELVTVKEESPAEKVCSDDSVTIVSTCKT